MFMDGLPFQNVRRSPFWVFSYRRWWLDFQNPPHSSARRFSSLRSLVPQPTCCCKFFKVRWGPCLSLGTCWQEDSGGVEQERGSTVEPVTHGGSSESGSAAAPPAVEKEEEEGKLLAAPAASTGARLGSQRAPPTPIGGGEHLPAATPVGHQLPDQQHLDAKSSSLSNFL